MPLESYDLPAADPPVPVERTAANLRSLRAALEADLPARDPDRTLRVASWNVKQLGARPRLPESSWYIAEVISHFDVVGLREVAGDLGGLERVRQLLGPAWAYLVSDVAPGSEDGERVGVLYDSRTVQFTGIAGELELPETEVVERRRVPLRAIARTPLMASFRAGGFEFALASATLGLAVARPDDDPDLRAAEAEAFALNMAQRVAEDRGATRNLLLLGDFDFHDAASPVADRLRRHGFGIPVGHDQLMATSVGGVGRFYDQIAYRFADRPRARPRASGVVALFDHVFRDDQYKRYRPELRKSDGTAPRDALSYYRQYFRRDELSDHLPLWAAFDIDVASERLGHLAG
jgi:endonuclease/exonuclease/phosphatase family metal-dependent hydrolase